MDYLDVLDAQGNKTGQKKIKKEVHRDGDWHRTAHVWLLNSKREFLIQKRSPNKDSHPNLWDISAAGHVDAGENGLTAAIRETREELGLDLPKEDFQHLFTNKKQGEVLNNGTFINNEFQDVYLVKMDADIKDLKMQTEEVSALKWVSSEELERRITERDTDFVPHDEEYRRLFKLIRK